MTDIESILAAHGSTTRRRFLTGLITTAFATPVVASFALSGSARAATPAIGGSNVTTPPLPRGNTTHGASNVFSGSNVIHASNVSYGPNTTNAYDWGASNVYGASNAIQSRPTNGKATQVGWGGSNVYGASNLQQSRSTNPPIQTGNNTRRGNATAPTTTAPPPPSTSTTSTTAPPDCGC